MDLRQLEIIRAIAETGSFTAAGERLHVSQSAVSRQILLLEEELGETVFHRVGRRIRITPAGESLVQLSNRVFRDLHETVSAISETQENIRGTLRLVGGMTVCLYVFPTLLSEIRRVHPQLELKITVGSTDRSIAMLRSGAGDLGLLTLPIDAADLISVPVLREELLVVSYPSHPFAKRRMVEPDELNRQPFILFESG
jgi:DNA-binding transcriptional LysR family regulator